MQRSIAFAVALASITACGARGDASDAGASAGSSSGAASQGETSSTAGDVDSSSGAQSIGSADGSGGTEGDVPLAIDFPADKVPYCVTEAETVHDYVVPGSGDGGAITCAHTAGSGGGVLPAGVSIDPDTCAVVGEPPADRYGTWAVIVKATQGDVEIWVPYCVTQGERPNGDASIEVVTADAADAALLPLHGTFAPDAPLALGGSGDPLFRIVDPARCGESCAYSYQFFASASPFDLEAEPFFITDTMIIVEDDPIGMSHGIELSGPPIADTAPDLVDRPWVFGLELDYCLAENAEDCDTTMRPETVARFRYSVVMSPE